MKLRRVITQNMRFVCLLLFIVGAFASPGAIFADAISYSQCASCGSTGGPALQILVQGVNTGTVAALGLINASFAYSPGSQGPIVSIDASVEKDLTVSQATPVTATGNSGFRPLIEQDGNYYMLDLAVPITPLNINDATSGTTGYGTLSATGLTASDFVLFNFSTGTFGAATANPNFSGDTMFFGIADLATGGSQPFSDATFDADFEDLSLTINDPVSFKDATFSDLSAYTAVEFPSPVPEPASLLLLGSGLFGIWAKRRKFSIEG